MTQIISFAWTTPALLAGEKTVTRRNWKDRHARLFHAGDVIRAYDKSPRFKGRHVATITLTADPTLQCACDIEPHEYALEGFHYLDSIGAKLDGKSPREVYDGWLHSTDTLYVVRFRLLSIERT